MTIFSKLFRKEKKTGCPNCYQNEIISFGKDLLESKFISLIETEKKIGEIEIYKCQKCKTEFYLKGYMFEKIFDGQIENLKKWNEKDLVCPQNLKNEIEEIGYSENWNSEKIVPSKVILKSGIEYEFTTILFSTNPPLGHYFTNFKNVFFIDGVNSIKKSDYGLSKEIREKSLIAEEKRMGFYPIVVKNRINKEVVINGIELFFNSRNIKGSELELANEEWNHRKEYIYSSKNEMETTIVMVKK